MSLAHILIVDDDLGVRASLRMVLEFSDYEVTEASSGGEALEAAETLTPDLVICDINMPGMDGIRTVESLLRIPHSRQIPVIFISGLASDEQRRRIAALGAFSLLTKPFSIDQLLELVRKHLNIPGAQSNFTDSGLQDS